MSLDARLAKLQERHASLEEEISTASQHPSIDSIEISELKRRKLALKEEIEKLKSEPTLH